MFFLVFHGLFATRFIDQTLLVACNTCIDQAHSALIRFLRFLSYVNRSYENMINSFWPSNTILRKRSGSTLAQVMACCLTTPSHYLNQCRLIMNEDLWQSPDGNFTRGTQAIYWGYHLEIACPKFHSNLQGANELKLLSSTIYMITRLAQRMCMSLNHWFFQSLPWYD